MFEPVSPVPAAAPTVSGIVRSAITPNDGARWESGIAWRSERCVTARTFDPCGSGFEDPPIGGGGDGINYYRPVAFRVEDECGTRGQVDDGRARRQALAVTSYMVARELHGGALSQANPYDTPAGGMQANAYLAEGGTTVAGVWAPDAGLGALEEAARDAQLGQDVFIHMPTSLVPLMRDAIVREGQLLRTRTGAVVVADSGYPGTGPDVAGTSEVQTVTITGAPTGGDLTLSFGAEETAAIPFNAAAGVVQTALNALPSLDGVVVTGVAGGPYTVMFPAEDGNVAQMTADDTGLTGGTDPAVVVATTTPGVAPSVEAGVWMYATGPVQVRLSEVVTNRIDDHRLNRVVMTADRSFAATYDPCTLFSIQITDPSPGE